MTADTRKVILVVEDNQINRMTLSGLLSAEYRTLEAENGREAFSVLEEHGEEISLILLDIIMPIMDGYTFLSLMKENPAYSSIPVIVTTQSDSEADEIEALSHGATDFVAKPYKPEIILHRVASIIRLRETAAMVNQFQYDRLTGLYSKEFFYQRVREILRQNPEQEYDIVCSDIDNFKLINDVFGVPAGNQLLCNIADLYRKMVGDDGISGRLNADQFVCLLRHQPCYTDQIFIRSGSIVNALSNARNVMMKWGVYAVEDRTISVEQMCDRALLAARSIKGQYGKYFATYDDKLRGKLLREQAIIDNMESALADGQFKVYFQPKYQIKGELLAGAEALVRWIHPEWGIQSPAEFIPLFEKNGFITNLDRFVWERSCSFLQKWDEMGLPSIPVSVNVSRADIYHVDIARILTNTVQKYGLAPARLHLEITESAYTEDPDQIIETVGRLRELGFIIEMDDFGSGYSSLNMLNQMPIDVLKLDMKFIQSETAKPADQGILRFIMDLARWMELSVVAEGVETREQLNRLLEIGCDYVQGYYFARPMPGADFERLLQKEQTAAMRSGRDQYSDRSRLRQILLVADRDAAYRDEVRQTFEELFQIVEVETGQDALRCIQAHTDKISALFLSATLPGGDAFTTLDTIKRDRSVWGIPVIITGPPDAQMEEKALDLGAEEYAVKPHTSKSLWKRALRAMGTTTAWEWERALQEEANQDGQTGLLNRCGVNAAMDDLMDQDAPLAVCIFELNNPKRVAGPRGQAEDNRLIEEFCRILRACTRKRDILARLDGNKFIILVKQTRSREDAVKKGVEINRAFREWTLTENVATTCTASIMFCQTKEMAAEMVAHADRVLHVEEPDSDYKGKCHL